MTPHDFPFEACADCRAHETAARLERVVETTGSEVYFLDASRRRFLHANGSAARDTGYSIAELLSMGPGDLLPSYASASGNPQFAAFLEGERDEMSTRATVRRKDGSEFPVHLHVFRSEIGGGTIFVAVASDISARVRAEREQREREERMMQIHAAARIAAWDCDLLRGTTVLATSLPGADAMPAGVPLPNSLWDTIVHADDRDTVSERWRAHLRGESAIYLADWRLLCSDGTYRWVRSQARVSERNERGKPTRIAGIYVDVHEQKTAEIAFAESEAILESLLASWPDGIVILDPELAVVRCNPAAIALYQRSGHELKPGDRFVSLVAEQNRHHMQSFLAEVAVNGSSTLEVEDVRRGAGAWTEITAWRTGTKAAPGLIAVTARDITPRKRAEAAQTRAARLESLGLMAGGIAHDFNNLLMTFAVNIDLALMETEPGGTVHACLVDAKQASLRAGDLVRQLLAYSGKGATHTRPSTARRWSRKRRGCCERRSRPASR